MKTRNQRIKAVLRFVFFLSAIVLVGCETSENSEEPTQDAGVDSSDDMANDMNDASDDTAEDKSHKFVVRIENISQAAPYLQSGVFNTPHGDMEPGPAIPGKSYTFSFHAAAGNKLSFTTMFVKSNDLFYAPKDEGIDLFDEDGEPVHGDITSHLYLWDVGTEANEPIGTGDHQPLNQSDINSGDPDSNKMVRMADDDDLPAVEDVVKLQLDHIDGDEFEVTIENISDDPAYPLAPGVWVVHEGENPLFTQGEEDPGLGLEALAEDGDPSELFAYLESNTGLATPFAPGIWVIHRDAHILFEDGSEDRSEGLEALAEDGSPSEIDTAIMDDPAAIAQGIFNTPVGADEPGPLTPGNAYEFSFEADMGDYLTFATMFVQSNDLFIAPSDQGIELFPNGSALSGDITDNVLLWDVGTEVNEYPGTGLNQPLRQAGPDMGDDENSDVSEVDDGFTYSPVDELVKITIAVE